MPKYAVRWNNDNTYLEYSKYWDWTEQIDKATTFSSHEEVRVFIQREAPHFHDSCYYECPYSIVEVPEKESNSGDSKFVIRWLSDNTYLKTLNSGWFTSLKDAKQFNLREDAEKYITMPNGVKFWRYRSGSYSDAYAQVSIDEIHILNFKY